MKKIESKATIMMDDIQRYDELRHNIIDMLNDGRVKLAEVRETYIRVKGPFEDVDRLLSLVVEAREKGGEKDGSDKETA